jgi:predicted hotdog family 3-hydroxylacyl-ACP dehydratase
MAPTASNLPHCFTTAQAEQSEAAVSALWRRFEYQVDPDGRLPKWRRRELAQHALAAHMAGMRLAKARRRQLGEAS